MQSNDEIVVAASSGLKAAAGVIGSYAALARALKVKRQVVDMWRKRGVPAERVLEIERATGGKVGRHQFRPDLYPPEDYKFLSQQAKAA